MIFMIFMIFHDFHDFRYIFKNRDSSMDRREKHLETNDKTKKFVPKFVANMIKHSYCS